MTIARTNRVQAIYEPTGRAAEYAPLAVNLYRGCIHGCLYCYAPNALHSRRTEFHSQAKLRPGVLDALQRDSKRLAGDARPVLLSFSTDPYQPGLPDDGATTRQALLILRDHRLTPAILTKGGVRCLHDKEILRQAMAWLGQTLTCDSHEESRKWEPRAALPESRAAALMVAHEAGIRTWASLEPVLAPEGALNLIALTTQFVDHYKVGKLNYHPLARTIDWASFRRRVMDLLEGRGFNRILEPGRFEPGTYYLKSDLLKAGRGKP